MTAVQTESEKILAEIMVFTNTIVGIASMVDIENSVKAQAIFMAEQILHQIIVDKIVEKCVEKSIPCNN